MTDMKTCPRCGAPRNQAGREAGGEAASPGGLCPACLMKMGFDSRSGVIITGPEAAPRPPPPAVEDLRAHFPQLEILEHIGQGGMGAVYKARQRSLERDVALKVLTIDTSADPSFGERFEREAKTLASLSHPGIVSVIDSGRAGPWFYFVMEFIDGASLRQMLRAGEVAPREALSIVGQICDALQYAHDHGVVHRDIKPENVLVTRKGQVKILDFGLAKLMGDKVSRENLTAAQQVMGTPHYMAPEQWEKPQTVDHRADIYALGVVFYELLTGELPLGRFLLPSQKVQIEVRLDDVVVKTLEKEPERRYQQASEVKSAVDGIASKPMVHAEMAQVAALPPRPWFRWVALGCGALLLIPVLFAVPAFLLLDHKTSGVIGSTLTEPPGRPENEPRAGKVVPIPPAAVQSDTREWSFVLSFDPSESPTVVAPVGAQLAADATELLDINSLIARAWREYLDLEKVHAHVVEKEDARLIVEVDSFAEQRAKLRDQALADISRRFPRFEVSFAYVALENWMCLGPAPTRAEISTPDGRHFNVVGMLGLRGNNDVQSRTAARLWQMQGSTERR
jgi:predicted Ser/Thr protein kinase